MNTEHIVVRNNIIYWVGYINGAKTEKKVGVLRGRTIEVHRDKSKHVLNELNSFGFNQLMIQEVPFDVLRVICTNGEFFETTKDFILKVGIRNICYSWDAQIHLPLSKFGLSYIKKWEDEEFMRKNPHMRMIRMYNLDITEIEGFKINE